MIKNREATEQKLIDAIGVLINEQGFEKLAVNAVAKKAGVSKVLIYRYFNSLDELIYSYMAKNDFWINMQQLPLPESDIKDYLKNMFRRQITQLRENIALKRLYRWELSTSNSLINKLRQQRESTGLRLTQFVSQFSHVSQTELTAIATIISSAISYLILLEENYHEYNGINIQSNDGWEQIAQGIDKLIDLTY